MSNTKMNTAAQSERKSFSDMVSQILQEGRYGQDAVDELTAPLSALTETIWNFNLVPEWVPEHAAHMQQIDEQDIRDRLALQEAKNACWKANDQVHWCEDMIRPNFEILEAYQKQEVEIPLKKATDALGSIAFYRAQQTYWIAKLEACKREYYRLTQEEWVAAPRGSKVVKAEKVLKALDLSKL